MIRVRNIDIRTNSGNTPFLGYAKGADAREDLVGLIGTVAVHGGRETYTQANSRNLSAALEVVMIFAVRVHLQEA